MKRLTCLVGVSLMLCVGQQSEKGLLAIPDKMIEVGLPVQLSVSPLAPTRGSTPGFYWLHGGRYLGFVALLEEQDTIRMPNSLLYVYDTQMKRVRQIAPQPVSAYLFTERNIYYLTTERTGNQNRFTVYQYDPSSGQARSVYTQGWQVPEEAILPPDLYTLSISPNQRYLLMSVNRGYVLLDLQTRREIIVEAIQNGSITPTGFLDNENLLGMMFIPEEKLYERVALHIPSGTITRRVVVPREPTPAPQKAGNLRLKLDKGALYLVSLTTKSDRYQRVLLTYDCKALPSTPVMAVEGAPELSELEPLSEAQIAPDESGLAFVNIHGQLFYVPLKKREPQSLVEAVACGKEITDEMLVRHLTKNANQVGIALLMYATDYDEYLPLAGDVELVIRPYLRSPDVFKHPLTGQSIFIYLMNGQNLMEIREPARTQIGIFDWGDPNYVIAIYADAHAKLIRRDQ